MLTKTNHDLRPVTNTCPACRLNLTTQRELMESSLKRIYMKNCALHLSMFDAADARERAKEERREAGA